MRLYDQDGRPIELGEAIDPTRGVPLDRDVVLDGDRRPVTNVYPVDQYTLGWSPDGATTERQPVPPLALVVPPLQPPSGTGTGTGDGTGDGTGTGDESGDGGDTSTVPTTVRGVPSGEVTPPGS